MSLKVNNYNITSSQDFFLPFSVYGASNARKIRRDMFIEYPFTWGKSSIEALMEEIHPLVSFREM